MRLADIAVNRTGSTITLELTDADGAAVTVLGSVAWISAAVGTVRVTPAAGDFLFSGGKIRSRFKVVTGGEIEYFPNGDPDVWIPRKP